MTSHLLALLLSVIAVILPLRYGCSDISGGRCVRAHSRPFMAAIQRANTTVCGGVLVKRQWVLTAAHCKLEDLDASVVLGAHRAFKTEKQQQRFEIMDLFPHPQFDSDSKENDIMLLKGDSGGPLICGRKYSGIVSFGEECGMGDKPGVYTRLTEKYMDWIKKTVSLNGEA